ncbi:MAG TPA: transglycosylase SLT domain-containing protein, partial [Burkholderiales bacterium]|nr:transglycosylase SLT domain-containing protein [Burkholderiales bacterium]
MRKALALAALLLQACASAPPPAPAPELAPVPEASATAKPPAVLTEPPPAPPVTAVPRAETLPKFDGRKVEIEEPLKDLPTIDRTAAPDDLWERVRRGVAMPNLGGPLVKRKTAEYAANQEYLQRIFDRSRLYLYHIVEEIEKRNLPTELALLPIIESAFNPMAYSRARASGLWQFIPGTGRVYKLEQSWWYDERRDVVQSTSAALDYLTKLYEMHGDWHLALASYNWGEGA